MPCSYIHCTMRVFTAQVWRAPVPSLAEARRTQGRSAGDGQCPRTFGCDLQGVLAGPGRGGAGRAFRPEFVDGDVAVGVVDVDAEVALAAHDLGAVVGVLDRPGV